MNTFNLTDALFTFQDGFRPVKILAGERIFELFAPQRTSIIFGVAEHPWAAAAYRINTLIVQLEPNLNEWDSIAIEISGNARLVRHNTVIYSLQCIIPPDVPGLYSNFFYRCPECDGHVYECAHLLIANGDRRQPSATSASANQASKALAESEPSTCPNCGSKIQSLAPGVSFCLDCDWECGLVPIN